MTGQGWPVDHNTVAVSPCSGSRALPLVLSGIGSKFRCFRNSFPDARLKIPCSVLGMPLQAIDFRALLDSRDVATGTDLRDFPLKLPVCSRSRFFMLSKSGRRIEYVVRASLGHNQWVVLIYYPDNSDGHAARLDFDGARLGRPCAPASAPCPLVKRLRLLPSADRGLRLAPDRRR
jgi:hypothetical protein